MNPDDFFKSLKEKISFLIDRDQQKLVLTTYRDWLILIVAFSLVSFVTAGIGLYLFIKINSGEIFIAEREGTRMQKIIDETELSKTIAHYEEKQAMSQELLLNRPRVVDPSR